MGHVNEKMQQLVEMLDEIDNDGDNLTDWEIKFVSDLIDKQSKYFTDAQEKQIQRIYTKCFG